MTKIFVDTSGWGHLVDEFQRFSNEASAIYNEAKGSGGGLITTNYVIAELTALLISPFQIHHSKRVGFINSIKASRLVEVVYISKILDEQAWQLLENRTDKAWSLVDCSSFVLMKELGISSALTTDHNFEQAGFLRLLK